MGMGIVELVTKIGDKNIKIQGLDFCLIEANYSVKKGTVISFGTDQQLLPDGTKDFGMIIWLPRDRVKEILGK